jgi:adenylyl- and sulfurtransferase ThiI
MPKINYSHILCRIASEIFLKGKNQHHFTSKLAANIKSQTLQNKVLVQRGRMLMPFFEEHHKLQLVFGVQSYSPAIFIEKSNSQEEDLEEIKKIATEVMKSKEGTFHVKTKRSDKFFFLTSVQVNHQVGEQIERTNEKINFQLKLPEHVLGIEITPKGTFIYNEQISCEGGLPAGIEGEGVIEIKGEEEVLAALLMMKRGVEIKFIETPNFLEYQPLMASFFPKRLKTVPSVKTFQANCKNSPCVVVLGDTLESEESHTKAQEGTMFLSPLVAWTKEQVREEIRRVQKLLENTQNKSNNSQQPVTIHNNS